MSQLNKKRYNDNNESRMRQKKKKTTSILLSLTTTNNKKKGNNKGPSRRTINDKNKLTAENNYKKCAQYARKIIKNIGKPDNEDAINWRMFLYIYVFIYIYLYII